MILKKMIIGKSLVSTIKYKYLIFKFDQKFFVLYLKTIGLEEKASACSMLVCCAKELKEGFVNYVEETTKLMISLLSFYSHKGKRFFHFNKRKSLYSLKVFVLRLLNLYHIYLIVLDYVIMTMFINYGSL